VVWTAEQNREYQRVWKAAIRDDWINEHGPCAWCGSWENLEVDHEDPSKKLYGVECLWGLALDNPKRITELAKCQVLCHECHRIKTRDDRPEVLHGTLTRYKSKYYRCRCNECKAANAEYQSRYYEINGR
jgi:5-methylcytosine-specific restriction endonuclease McrA